MISFLDVLIAVFSLTILAVPGFILVKTKLIKGDAAAPFSALVLYACQPMLMFMGFQKTPYDSSIGINMLIVAGIAFVVHFIMIGIMYLCFRNKDNSAKINCLRFASVFSNCGYMGFPFLQTLFGGTDAIGELLIYGSVVVGVFNILTWSIGVYMMTGDKKQMSVKKALLNPTVLGLFLGLIVFFALRVPIVDIAVEGTTLDTILTKLIASFNFLADMVTPLAMIVIGIRLANVSLKNLFLDKWAYVSCAFKLIVMSIVSIFSVAFLPISTTVKYAIFFLLSMPSATGTVLFAVQFGGDSESGSVFVLLSTILSILTIPLMFLLFNQGFGIVI